MIAIVYEHQRWFEPLFAELDRRGVAYERVDGASLSFSPRPDPRHTLVVNRMSPSAGQRGHAHAIFSTGHYLARLEQYRVPTVNGREAFAIDTSKVTQLALLERLGLAAPRTRIVNRAALIPEAAADLRFPILVKPNIGGSGAGIRRFDAPAEIVAALEDGGVDLGLDHTGLVQELRRPRGGHIVRVEVLDGELLYAIRVFPDATAGFNLCPADICRADSPGAAAGATTLRIEPHEVPPEVARDVLRIAEAAHLDVGGIEYLVDDDDGRVSFYDVNALSNFVSDAERIVGFDPWPTFADYLESRVRALAA